MNVSGADMVARMTAQMGELLQSVQNAVIDHSEKLVKMNVELAVEAGKGESIDITA